MKKRILVFLLAAVLLLTSLPAAQASGALCFVAVNDTIPLSLPGDFAPFQSGNTVYVPYSAYDANPGGVIVSYNVDHGTFVLFTRSRRLVYNLDVGTVTDEDGRERASSFLFRGGILYLPAVESASHFGLSVSILTSKTGCAIIRFTDGSQVYENQRFVNKAENLISYVLAHNENQQEQGETEEGKQTEADPELEEEIPEDLPATVYLAFAGEAVSEQTLTLLNRLEYRAAFFLTKEQIEQNRDLVRAIYASGHTIGVTAAAEAREQVAAWDAANCALDETIFTRTVMALSSSQVVQTTQFRVFSEADQAASIQTALENPEITHFVVCRSESNYVLESLYLSEASVLQLLDNTQLQ